MRLVVELIVTTFYLVLICKSFCFCSFFIVVEASFDKNIDSERSLHEQIATKSEEEEVVVEERIHLDQNKAPAKLVTQEECGIWLAPSTIPGSGLGMYAGKDYRENEELGYTGDAVVPVIDFEEHTKVHDRTLSFLWNEYLWSTTPTLGGTDGRFVVSLASTGFGSAANSFLPLYNVIEWFPTKDNTVGLHRSVHPSVGSSTPYRNRKSSARTTINSGQELFVSYTDSWFESRHHLGPVPLENTFNEAQELIENYKLLQNKVGDALSSNVWDEFVKNTTYKKKSRVIASFIHDDTDEMYILTKTNTTLSNLRKQQLSRSLSWLQQHGTCGDNLVARPSTLPTYAGYGAFATRDLPKGLAVAQLPMIHIPYRKVLDMYNFASVGNDDEDENHEVLYIPQKDAGLMGYQLLLNYCFGHNQSTLLLCPYGPMTNYINHNQTLANVKLKWGRKESGNHNPEFFEKSVSDFTTYNSAKLAMELVATRDIKEGEEIFLDYGDEWEQAWQEHVQNWKPVRGAEMYKSAAEFNADKKTRLPSIFEQMDGTAEHFPPNIELKCFLSFVDSYVDTLEYHREQGTLDYFVEHNVNEYLPCIILGSHQINDETYVYTIHNYKMIEDAEEKEEGNKEQTVAKHIVHENVPRDALRFYDLAYTDDSFLPGAFRHDMRIPDDLFPRNWKNLLTHENEPEEEELI